MPIFDFCCDGGHTSERLISAEIRTVVCGCGRVASRNGVNRGIGIVGPTTDTRGMFRRFQEATADIDHAATRIEAQTGRAVETPDFWGAAKARAAAITRAGENTLPPRQE